VTLGARRLRRSARVEKISLKPACRHQLKTPPKAQPSPGFLAAGRSTPSRSARAILLDHGIRRFRYLFDDPHKTASRLVCAPKLFFRIIPNAGVRRRSADHIRGCRAHRQAFEKSKALALERG